MKITYFKLFFVFIILLMVNCTPLKTDFLVRSIPKSRVIILTDMMNEPDDSQTMVRLLMYANEMDIEGLIAVSSCHQYLGKKDLFPVIRDGKVVTIDTLIQDRNGVHPQEINKRILAYGTILNNLKLHTRGWPSVNYLLDKVGSGPAGYGMTDVGIGKSTTGSKLIENAILKNDQRPLYICINAGANTLAQALIDLQNEQDSTTFNYLIKKIRVYDDAGQDNAGAWIASNYPRLHYQRSQHQVFNFMNEKGPITWDSTFYVGKGQHVWAKAHIQTNHGNLGKLYPDRMQFRRPDLFHTLEGGGTSTWIGHVNKGLYVPEEITWGGWGGRFSDKKNENIVADQLKWANLVETENPFKPFYMYSEVTDKWIDNSTGISYNDIGTPIYRWRQAYQNDFEARMDWCIKSFEKANHNPVAAFFNDSSDGVIYISAKSGEKIFLDASASSDPDQDELSFYWFNYQESGTYNKTIFPSKQFQAKTNVLIPGDAKGKQLHIILEVKDNNPIVSLYDYRRIVINVE